MPKTVTFNGQAVTVPFIGGRRLRQIAAALRSIASGSMVTVAVADGDSVEKRSMPLLDAIRQMPPSDYPRLVLLALQHALDTVSPGVDLSEGERLFYGALGDMIGLDAETVADAPLDDLMALCTAIYEQERETQAGKWLIRTFLSGEQTGTSTDGESVSESPSATTTRRKSARTPAATGIA